MNSAQLYEYFNIFYDVLAVIGYYILAIVFISLSAILYVSRSCKSLNSPLISCGSLFVFLVMMKILDWALKKYLGLSVEVVRHLFYTLMTTCYLLNILMIIYFHNRYSVSLSNYSKLIVLSCFTLANIVLVKYILRMYFDIDNENIRFIYASAINSIKICITLFTLAIAAYSLVVFATSKKIKKGF
jgi:hypothetical protein